jgi:predicted nucleotidyltransferase
MEMLELELKSEIRDRLETALGERLRRIVLYGSEARGDAQPDSDIDLLVVLADPIRLGDDIETITRALYPLQRRIPERPLHAMPASDHAYRVAEYALYRQAQEEGIPL